MPNKKRINLQMQCKPQDSSKGLTKMVKKLEKNGQAAKNSTSNTFVIILIWLTNFKITTKIIQPFIFVIRFNYKISKKEEEAKFAIKSNNIPLIFSNLVIES